MVETLEGALDAIQQVNMTSRLTVTVYVRPLRWHDRKWLPRLQDLRTHRRAVAVAAPRRQCGIRELRTLLRAAICFEKFREAVAEGGALDVRGSERCQNGCWEERVKWVLELASGSPSPGWLADRGWWQQR